jgi:acetylornithine deacetylase
MPKSYNLYEIYLEKKGSIVKEDKQRVFNWLDENKMGAATLLSDMVRIPSLNQGTVDTGDEREMAEFVSSYMKDMGLDVEILSFDKEGKRPNVAGTYCGSGGGRSILFNAHMDVVPIDEPDKWMHKPFGGEIADNRVYGRGACDDKQGITAFVYAVKALKTAGVKLRGDVILLASAGEESCEGGTYGPGPVAKELMKRKNKPSGAIVCELSNMDIQIESASLFFFELIVKGKTCHCGSRNQCIFPQPYGLASGNEIGVDALEHLLPIVEMFYRKEKDWNLNTMRSSVMGTGDNMGVGAFYLNPVSFSGGGYIGSIPAEARITYGVWFDNKISKEDMMNEIRKSVDAVCFTDSWLKENPPEIIMPIIQDWPGYSTERDSDFVRNLVSACEDALGRKPVVTGFKAACDATWISMAGIPSVTFGNGTMANRVHTIDEYCDIDDLVQCAKAYASIMMDWCA